MGGLAGYINERGMPDLHRARFLKALPAPEGETVRFHAEGAAVFFYAGEKNHPLTQRRGEQVLRAVLDGRFSNSAALKDRLRRRGHPLNTGEEVELALVSYIEWGKAAPEHFAGDFSLAVWSDTELFLVRGQSGRKPLYYACLDGFPIFATDPAVLFAHPNLPLRLNPQGAVRLLCPSENAVCEPVVPEGIECLQPGSFLLWQRGKGTQRDSVRRVTHDETPFPGGDFSSAFEDRLRAVLSAEENQAECFLTLRESESLAEWLQLHSGGDSDCRCLALWEDGDCICPHATTITGEEAALRLTELVTALGRADFTPDEAAAFQLCRKLRKSFSSAVSAAGGHLLLGGRPERQTVIPTAWLLPELREIADIPINRESPEQLLQKNLTALFERSDRLASHAGLQLKLPFADPELARLCRRASRQSLAELLNTLPIASRFWPHPYGKGWTHGIESRFRALLARADAPIWQLCHRKALTMDVPYPEIMAKLVTASHWLEHFRIAPR